MPRYIKQFDNDSCGPIAVINISKWLCLNYTIKNDYKRIYKETKCKKNRYGVGTLLMHLDHFIRKEFCNNLKIRKVKRPNVIETRNHLLNGGSVLMAFSYKENNKIESHYALFTNYYCGKWIGHNATTKLSTSQHSDQEIYNCFYGTCHLPSVWFLEKI